MAGSSHGLQKLNPRKFEREVKRLLGLVPESCRCWWPGPGEAQGGSGELTLNHSQR